ncbi:MAG: DUF3592 domain-containing protein [Methylococcales bacterium]
MSRKKMITYLSLILIASFVIGALWKYFDSRNWIETPASISHINMSEVYNRPISSMSTNKSFTEYKIDLKYEFTYKDKQYTGKQIYPLIPNVYSVKKHTEEILDAYKANQKITVFFNPNNPNDSCLITSKNVSALKVFSISFILLTCVSATLAGVVYFLNRFDN